ncbi:MAG: hypothetical protein ABL921_19115, partial [Pirellula sp.]
MTSRSRTLFIRDCCIFATRRSLSIFLVALVPSLRLGTHSVGGSVARTGAPVTQIAHSAGGACNAVGYEAEPRNQMVRAQRSLA